MTTTKYAIDLHDGDRILDKKTDRVVFIDWIRKPDDLSAVGPGEGPISENHVRIYAYFEDDGSDWTRDLDLDSKVKVVEA